MLEKLQIKLHAKINFKNLKTFTINSNIQEIGFTETIEIGFSFCKRILRLISFS